ncbi:MAG: carbohydrate kinase family protein [Candidatus Kerfeldbacteria bacterium]|nr:carbohydrate kinase family protein [Candidatus Kerfeldbacteria bacterium]
MFDVTTIGSATQDIYVFSRQFHFHEDPRRKSGLIEWFAFGTKIELDDIVFEVGGGATNAAYTFKNQGLKTACVARIGNDGAGFDVQRSLKQAGITDHLLVDRRLRTGSGVIFLGRTGERTILVYRGATKNFKADDIKKSWLTHTRWVYITSLGGDIVALERVVRLAHSHSVKISFNPGKREIDAHPGRVQRLLRHCTVVQLNREEAAALTGRAYANIRGMFRQLREWTPGIILITEGDRGAYYSVDNTAWRVILNAIPGKDMTGAGDAFGSGFVAGLIRFKGDVTRALRLALNNAASTIKQIGAKNGLLKRNDRLNHVTYTTKQVINL